MTPERRTILIGIAVFLVFAFAVTSWSPIAPRHLESRLQDAATESLSGRAFRWAQVTVEGQVATLEGEWPSEGAHEAALDALWSAEWSGGRIAGGIAQIIDNTQPQEGEARSRVVAVLDENGLSLSGVVPDDEARTELLEFADLLFPGEFEARLTARSEPAEREAWLATASQLLSALSRLERGVVVLENELALLYGVTDSVSRADVAAASLSETPDAIEAQSLIFAEETRRGDIPDDRWCREYLDAAALMGRLRFDPGSSAFQSASADNLVHVARVAAACPAEAFTISVRPVVSGNAPAETLAAERGEAVRQSLAQYDLAIERFAVLVEPQQDQLIRIYPGIEGGS